MGIQDPSPGLNDDMTRLLRHVSDLIVAGQSRMETRFDAVDARFDRVESRLDRLEGDVAVLKADVGVLKADVAGLKASVATLETGLAGTQAQLNRLEIAFDRGFKRVDAQFEELRVLILPPRTGRS